MSKRNILSVSTETEETVEIDGKSYGFVGAQVLDFKDALWLARAARKIQQAQDSDEAPSDAEMDERVEMLDRGVRLAIPELPDDVFRKLRGGQKLAIFQAFTRAAEQSGDATRQRPTDSSPDSSASTEAPAASGSQPPQPQSGDTPS